MSNNPADEDLESLYFGDDRKLFKEDRKRKQAKDRSKYKKSNIAKQLKRQDPQADHLLRGKVLSIQSIAITVQYEGRIYNCTLRGSLKKEKTRMKNLVTVGDYVLFEKIDEDEGVIVHVEERRSILSRADNLSRNKEQLIASNIDQVLITVSLILPLLKPFLIDRYIIAAKKGNMQPIVVINKVDLLETFEDKAIAAEQRELLEETLQAYRQTEIPVLTVSTLTGEGVEALKERMKDRSSVFSGQSGVGKSTLINCVTGLDLSVGEVVMKTKKGAHTTTTAKLVPLEFGGYCIDTPGIKSFGVWDLERAEIEQYYTEIFEKGHECKFPDCSHTHETKCAVKEAVDAGEISTLRYDSYVALLEAIQQEHKRR